MRDSAKTKQQLIDELSALRSRVAELEDLGGARTLAEQAVRETEREVRGVLEHSVDMIYRLNLNTGTYDYVSPSAKQQVGYSPEELAAMGIEGFVELIHPEDKQGPRADVDRLAARIAGAVREDVRPMGEYRIRHKELGYRWVSDTRSVVFDEEGAPVAIVGSLQDITDRKNAEDALRKAEREFRSVFENALDVIYRLNLSSGTYDYMSPSSKSLLGYTPQECVALGAEGLSRMVHPEDFDAVVRDVEKIIGRIVGDTQEDVVPTSEYRFNHRALGYRWMSDTRSIAFDENNAPVAVVGIIHDITERKEAEGALRASDQRLKDAMALGHTGYWEFEVDTQKISWSDQLFRLFERAPSLGAPTVEEEATYYSREQAEKLREFARRAIEQGEVIEYDFLATLPARGAAYMMGFMRPIKDASGRVVKLFGVFHDITERKMAAEAVRESEEKYRAIFSEARDGIALLEFDSGHIVDCNPEFERQTGRSLNQLKGLAIWELRPREKVQAAKRVFFEAREKGVGGSSELPFRKPDGEIVSVETRAKGVDIGGKRYLQTISRDMTERVKAEEALRRSEERFRIASQMASDLVYERDLHTGIATFYGDMDGRLGYGAGGFPRTVDGWAEHVHPDDLPKAVESMAGQLKVRGRVSSEYRMRRRDGTFIRWLDRFTVVGDEKTGDPVKVIGVATDVTELRRAEEELRHSEEYFRGLTENALEAIIVIDRDGTVRYESPSVQRVLGLEAQDRIGGSAFDNVHPDDRRFAVKAFAEMVGNPGACAHVEVRAQARDGRWRVLEVVGNNLLDNPAVGGIVANFRDITERKQAEQALRESEEKYRLLAENVTDVIWTMDMDLRFTYISPSVMRLRGRTVKEAMAERLEDIFPPSSLQALIAAFTEGVVAEATGQSDPSRSWTVAMEEYRKDGSLIWVEIRASFLRDQHGRPVGLVGVTRDITERKKAEAELRESQAKLRLVLDSTLEGIAVIDLNGTILEVNERLVQMVGARSKDELVGKSGLGYLAAGERDRAQAGMQANVESGVAALQEHRVVRHDGSELPVEGSGTLVRDASGNPVGFVTVMRDITERKRAEAELRLRDTAIENSLNAIAMSDMEGRITYVNKACVKLWGSDSKEDLLGKPFWALAHAAEPGREIGRAMLEKGAWEGEVVARNKDGRELIVQVASGLVRDDQGHPTHTISSLLDVTERRRAQEALRESEQHYAALVGNLADAVFEFKGGVITWCNERVEEIYGYPREELLGKSASFFYPSGISPREYVGEVSGALKEHGLFRGMAKSRRKDGGLVDIEYSLSQMPGKDPVELIAVARNVTDRVRAEEALRESERNFRSVLDNSRDVIHRLSLKTRTWDYVSPASKDLLGYSPDECIALGFDGMTALVHPDDLGGLKKDLEKLATRTPGAGDEKVSVTSEYRFKHKELGYRWLSDTRSVVRDERNKLIAVVGTIRDITERKQYSERLEAIVEERTRELKEAQEQLVRKERLAVLGQLAGGVGHELRNPLGAIKNAAYFLNMVLEKPEADVKETLAIVDREVATCERIISSLLDFARQRPPLRRKSNINTVVREALPRVTVPGNVVVVSQLDETLPPIQADPSQLGQVFGNLLLNAVQAMPGGGRLVVRSEASGPDWVAVSFTDTGVGISAEGLASLFEPLFSTKAKGIGLGLPLSKTLVEGHGGMIQVQSELGKGSTFTVKLPVRGGG